MTEAPYPINYDSVVCLAIAPEGGLIPSEVELLSSARLKAVHRGPQILRAEVAVPALLSRLSPV